MRPMVCLKQSSEFTMLLLRVLLTPMGHGTIQCYPRRFSVIGCRWPARDWTRRSRKRALQASERRCKAISRLRRESGGRKAKRLERDAWLNVILRA